MKSKFILLSAMLISSGAFAQSWVSTNGQKNVFLEEGTGTWCGYCPDGATNCEKIEANNPHAVVVSLHYGDGMEIPAIQTFVRSYPFVFKDPPYTKSDSTGYYIGGFPNGTVDRAINRADRGAWESQVNSRMSITPKVDVALSHKYDKATRKLEITIFATTLEALTGEHRVNVYLKEDKLTSEASKNPYYQHSYYYNDAGSPWYHKGVQLSSTTWGLSTSKDGYWHDNVVRAMLGGPWGTTGVIPNDAPAETTYSKTYTYTIPSTQNPDNMAIVGIVQAYNDTGWSGREVLNAVEAKFLEATGISSINSGAKFYIAPNPAVNTVDIKSTIYNSKTATVTLTNIAGQVVLQKSYDISNNQLNATIPVGNLPNGMYMVNLKSETLNNTQRLVVNH